MGRVKMKIKVEAYEKQSTNKITAENMLKKTKESILLKSEVLIKEAATNGLYEVFTDDDGSKLRVSWGE